MCADTHAAVIRRSDAVARLDASSLRPSLAFMPETISLAMGEPDFDTPPEIVEAAVSALRAGHTRYTDPLGDAELRDRLAEIVSARAAVRYERSDILITHGASAGLAAAVLALVNPGDRVVIPEPTYSLYADLVELAGGTPIFVPLLADYHLDFERLTDVIDGARLVMLCSPGNPTGAVYRADEWAQLARLVERSGSYVVSDEAYYALVYDGSFASALKLPALRERLIYAQTFSKAYAMTGWRLGYLAGPRDLIRAAGVIHRAFNGTNNAFVQRAALVALRGGDSYAHGWLAAFRKRREFASERLNAIGGVTMGLPEGGFYGFARYSAPIASTDLLARLASAGVAVRAGREYGPSGEHHFRISFATSREQVDAGIDRIAGVFAALAHDET